MRLWRYAANCWAYLQNSKGRPELLSITWAMLLMVQLTCLSLLFSSGW
jgi:hypothetical protein